MGEESVTTDGAGSSGPTYPSDSEKDRYIEIWKKAVETQMHFNEMSAKSRQLGLTFVAASLGVAVVMLARGDDFAISIGAWKIHVGVLLILAGLLALRGVRDLDLNVYHRMLRGAVTFGEDFERNYLKTVFDLEKGMTQAISHYSRFDDARVETHSSKYSYEGKRKITAEQKIKGFYLFCTLFLAIAAAGLLVINNFSQISTLLSHRLSHAEVTPIPGEPQQSGSSEPQASAETDTIQSNTPAEPTGSSTKAD